ncbi:unnamed protein product [Lampetra fluviatilis]
MGRDKGLFARRVTRTHGESAATRRRSPRPAVFIGKTADGNRRLGRRAAERSEAELPSAGERAYCSGSLLRRYRFVLGL